MTQLTKQEVFDTALNHIRAQGYVPAVEDGMCRYRTSTGLKCPVGALIPDDRYTPELEGARASKVRQVLGDEWFPEDYEELLCSLQTIHDTELTGDYPGTISEESMAAVARLHNLEYKAP